jgi:hypothetical protein
MTYPRSKNGYTDDGSLIRASNRQDHCPNCGSNRYRETVSMERCEACGLQVDYWGGGGNSVFESYMSKVREREKSLEEERQREQEREWQREQDHWNNSHLTDDY